MSHVFTWVRYRNSVA